MVSAVKMFFWVLFIFHSSKKLGILTLIIATVLFVYFVFINSVVVLSKQLEDNSNMQAEKNELSSHFTRYNIAIGIGGLCLTGIGIGLATVSLATRNTELGGKSLGIAVMGGAVTAESIIEVIDKVGSFVRESLPQLRQ